MANSSLGFPEEFKSFVGNEVWTYAKMMPQWPYEYLVRERVDRTLFEWLALFIRAKGYA